MASMHYLLQFFGLCLGINILMFVPAYLLKTDKLTDISYSLTFIIVALAAYAHSDKTPVQIFALILILLWAFRLGGFLFIRILKTGRDKRFDQMRQRPWAFFRFWFFQGLTVFLVLLPALLLSGDAVSIINWASTLGVLIFGTGLILEAVADAQKFKFKQTNPHGQWIDSGVWRISRHPNYLGEVMVWCGLYLFTFASLDNLSRLYGLASPIYIAGILLFFSGVPLLEKAADKKWGQLGAYKKYKREVPLLVPNARSLRR